MLDDLDRTLRTLLVQQLPRVTERIEAGGFDVSFDVPNREFKARLSKPTLSLYLYNIQENRDLRGRTWGIERRNGSVATRRPPVRLDCTYMVTAWSNEVEDEHRLLAGATRVLFRNPVLPQEALQGALVNGIDITTEVAQPEGLKDIVDIWSVLDNDLRPSVRVTVTVPLDVDMEYLTPPTREAPDINLDDPSWTPTSKAPTRYAGRLTRKGRPVAGARIRADFSSATTDKNGEFALREIRPGRKTVLVLADGQFYQFEADLPKDEVLELPDSPEEPATQDSKEKKGNGGDRPRRRPKS
jgi:hypothetical protein